LPRLKKIWADEAYTGEKSDGSVLSLSKPSFEIPEQAEEVAATKHQRHQDRQTDDEEHFHGTASAIGRNMEPTLNEVHYFSSYLTYSLVLSNAQFATNMRTTHTR
jgi:hypothetical protein